MNIVFIIITIGVVAICGCKSQHIAKVTDGPETPVKPFTGTTLLDTINYPQAEVMDKKCSLLEKN